MYWVLKRDDRETIVATDRFTFRFEPGRVVDDTQCVLQFKAVYPKGMKTKDIPVTIKKAIPDPDYLLHAPAVWNGREPIEVVPVITNLDAMKAAGAGQLHYDWDVFGGAVIKQVAPDRLILKRSQFAGPIIVQACVDNGGVGLLDAVKIQVVEPKTDPWVPRTPDKDEKPVDNQFYARDDKNEGTLFYDGMLNQPADAVFLKVYADDQVYKTESRKRMADGGYAFTVKLKPGLIRYKVEFGTKTGGVETVLRTVNNLLCGDAYLIDGQSNALAVDWGPGEHPDTSEWIRSFGLPGDDAGQGWGRRSAAMVRGRSAAGPWTLPSDWWKARRCRSASSTARWEAP